MSLGFKGHFFRTFPDTWETPWFPRSFAWLPVAAAKEAAEVFGAQMFPPDSGRRLKFQVGLELYTLHQVNSWYVHIHIYIYVIIIYIYVYIYIYCRYISLIYGISIIRWGYKPLTICWACHATLPASANLWRAPQLHRSSGRHLEIDWRLGAQMALFSMVVNHSLTIHQCYGQG